jgi:hypothetical protein
LRPSAYAAARIAITPSVIATHAHPGNPPPELLDVVVVAV